MTSAPLYNCLNCGRQFNAAVLKRCPVCQTMHLSTEAPSPSADATLAPTYYAGRAPASPGNWSPSKSNYARMAAGSAETVDSMGLAIQILGYVTAALVFLFFTFVWGPEADKRLLGCILGILVGALTAWMYQVLGALYRMIANYILFRTQQ